MESISITQLEYLLAIDKYGTFGKAAEACFITQPTLSMQIQKLEEQLGVTLLDRQKRPVGFTAMGEKVLVQAKLAVDAVYGVRATIQSEEAVVEGTFSMGIIPTMASCLAPLLVQEFSQKFPKVQLMLQEMETAEIIKAMKEERLDLALLATPLNEKGIEETPLFQEAFYVYFSEGHPLLEKKFVQEDDLVDKEVWLLKDGHCLRTQVVELCRGNSENLRSGVTGVHFEGGSLETLIRLVDDSSSPSFTFLPELMVLQMDSENFHERIRSFKDNIPCREVGLVHRTGYKRTRFVTDMVEYIQSQVPESVLREKEQGIYRLNPV
jgi:LysR family hydrogen peroxide-inducible transcriptional activator